MRLFEKLKIISIFIFAVAILSLILFAFGFNDFAYALMFCGTVIISMSLFFL